MANLMTKISGIFGIDDREDELENVAEPQDNCETVMLLYPTVFNEVEKLTGLLKQNIVLAINLSKVEPLVAKRIVDFMTGAIYGVNGGAMKLDENVFLFANQNVILKDCHTPANYDKGRFWKE